MTFCPRYSLSAIARVGGGVVLFTRLRCGQWNCEYCAKKNAAMWRAFLAEKLPQVADRWWLLTLTAHEHRRTEALSLENIRSNIDRLMKRAGRVWDEIEYVRVYERHPSSAARHAHLIVSGLSPFVGLYHTRSNQVGYYPEENRAGKHHCWTVRTWWKKSARAAGMGYMVDCRQVDLPRKAMFYVTKYLTKSMQDLHEKGLRHVQTTRGIGSPQPDSEYEWETKTLFRVSDFRPGEKLLDLQTGELVPPEYWEEFSAYPPEQS